MQRRGRRAPAYSIAIAGQAQLDAVRDLRRLGMEEDEADRFLRRSSARACDPGHRETHVGPECGASSGGHRSRRLGGHGAEAIHGNKSQNQRERVLAAFRAGQVRTLEKAPSMELRLS